MVLGWRIGGDMRFLRAPTPSVIISMTPQEAAMWCMGGSELWGAAPNDDGVYYCLREGKWIKVIVVERGETE